MQVARVFLDPSSRSARSQLADAIGGGAREILFIAGAGTTAFDASVVSLLETAKASRVELVTLEADSLPALCGSAEILGRAGLTVTRLRVRRPADVAAARDAFAAFAGAGVAVEAATRIDRKTLDDVALLPAALLETPAPIRAWHLSLALRPSMPNDPDVLGSAEATSAVERVEAEARRRGLTVRLDPITFLPPCLFSARNRVTHLFTLSRGGKGRDGYAQQEGCARCAVGDRCPGVPRDLLAREPELRVAPIEEERLRRRLTISAGGLEEQIARELVSREIDRRSDGSLLPIHTVRINFHCNQACHFCFVSTHLPPPDDAQVRAAILEIAHKGGELALSGGEPTLNPRLVEYVALGKSEGACSVELQTNATRLADPAKVAALAEAGLDVAFVSLHGSTAALSDAVTAAPGTFDQTVAGIDEIARSSIRLRLNFVFCEPNRADFPRWVQWVAARWPRAIITVSFVAASTDLVPRSRSLIPRYSDVQPFLAEGLRLAARAGIRVSGFESMCGLPLCLVPSDRSDYWGLPEIPAGIDRGEFVKTEACRRCDLDTRCYGLRRGYAELHGTDELRAVLRHA